MKIRVCVLGILAMMFFQGSIGASPFQNPSRLYGFQKTLVSPRKINVLGRMIVPGSERIRAGNHLLVRYVDYWMDYNFGLLRLSDKWAKAKKPLRVYALASFRAHSRRNIFKVDYTSVRNLALKALGRIRASKLPSPVRGRKITREDVMNITSLAIIASTAVEVYSHAAPDDPRLPELLKRAKRLREYLDQENVRVDTDL